MSIASSLSALAAAKNDIAEAITAKGGTVGTGAGFTSFADAIATIPSGGGDEPEPPQDGKTRLYIELPDRYRMDVPLYFSQTVTDGVLIDKGDGSEPFTLSGTGQRDTTLSYTESGEYCITLEVLSGTISLGGSSSRVVIGGSDQGYRNMLYKAEIGNNVTSISSYAFRYCYSLQSITIPDSVTSIGSDAFQSCYSLQSITIPDGVTSISSYAFQSCNSLQSVTIPDSVTSISSYAFAGCYSLQSITIPDNVTSISSSAFRYCISLQSVTIPDRVTSIGGYAFGDCTFMKEYIFLSTTPPTLSSTSAFANIPTDCQIYVPNESLEAYKTATNWTTYASYIYPMSERES